MTEAISVPAHELRRALTAVLPHCGEDDTLPALTCVNLEASGGWLYLVATDRYSMGVARVFVMGGCGDQDAMLPAKHAKALRRLLRDAGNGTAELRLADGKLTAAVRDRSATWPTSAAKHSGSYPGWRGMLGKMLAADPVHLPDDCGVNGELLAPAGAVTAPPAGAAATGPSITELAARAHDVWDSTLGGPAHPAEAVSAK
jgi:hypothetical protein